MGWLIFGLIIGVIILIITLNAQSANTEENNQAFTKGLVRSDFVIDKKAEYRDNLLFVDNTNKKWTVKDNSNTSLKTYNFSDLNEFELYEDGDSIIKGGLGVAGAVVGSNASSKKSKSTCKLIQLRIRVNDLNQPERVLTFLEPV